MTVPDLDPCRNCATPLRGPFCHACGQRRVDLGAPLRDLAAEAVADGLSWDGRVLRTLRTLFAAPGALSEAWAAGRRAAFVSPVRLYVSLGAAILLLAAVRGWLADEPAPSGSDAQRDVTMQAAYLVGKMTGALGVNALVLLVPVVGLATYVLFNRRRAVLAGHLVWALHVASAALAALAAWLAADTVGDLLGWRGLGVRGDAWLAALVVTTGGYAALAARRFFGVGWGGAAVAGALIALLPPVLLLAAIVATAFVLQFGG